MSQATLDVKKTECPQITEGKTYQKGATSFQLRPIELDGKEVYSYLLGRRATDLGRVHYPTINISPFAEADPKRKTNYIDNFKGENKERTSCVRGNVSIMTYTSSTDESKIFMIDTSSSYFEIRSGELVKDGEGVLVDYDHRDGKSPTLFSAKDEKVAILVQPEPDSSSLRSYLNCFIGFLSGDYITPDGVVVNDESQLQAGIIINKPIYGSVHLKTTDRRFYLQYTRNKEGVLVGEVTRTRLIPYHETAKGRTEPGSEAKEGEIEGCFVDVDGTKTPVYFSYYDPAGSGKQISREEYMKIRAGIIYESVPALPKELTSLLGF